VQNQAKIRANLHNRWTSWRWTIIWWCSSVLQVQIFLSGTYADHNPSSFAIQASKRKQFSSNRMARSIRLIAYKRERF